jgi:hypothetical protein
VRRPDEVRTLRAALGPDLAVWWVWAPSWVRDIRAITRTRPDGLRETGTSAADPTETLAQFPIALCDAIWDNSHAIPHPVETWAQALAQVVDAPTVRRSIPLPRPLRPRRFTG